MLHHFCVSICTYVLVKQGNWMVQRLLTDAAPFLRQYLYLCTSKASKLDGPTSADRCCAPFLRQYFAGSKAASSKTASSKARSKAAAVVPPFKRLLTDAATSLRQYLYLCTYVLVKQVINVC
jgi:hypothetical protein